MRILIYGAGVIGSINAFYLSRSGYEVAVLARGHRLEELRHKGLLYWNGKAIQKADVQILERLESDDRYDDIFLTVRAGELHQAREQLKDNVSPTIVRVFV